MINERTPCDLTNNIFDHILRANARITFMVLFLIITLLCAESPHRGTMQQQHFGPVRKERKGQFIQSTSF